MKTRYRVNWRGKLILQVYKWHDWRLKYIWQDATAEDIINGDK